MPDACAPGLGVEGAAPAALDEVPAAPTGGLDASPTLSMITDNAYPVDGRVVQILANDGCDLAGIRAIQSAIIASGAVAHVVAPHKGSIHTSRRKPDELSVDRSFQTACPAEADAIIIASGIGLQEHPAILNWVQTAYRHYKPIAAWGDGELVLSSAGIATDAPGVTVTPRATQQLAKALIADLGWHRSWDRAAPHPTRKPTPKEA